MGYKYFVGESGESVFVSNDLYQKLSEKEISENQDLTEEELKERIASRY